MSPTSGTQSDSRAVVDGKEQPESIGRRGSQCRCRLRNVAGMQPRPIQAVHQRGKLRCAQPHHAVGDRRPTEGTLLQPLPQQHQPGPVPGQDLQTVRPFRPEDENRARERIMLELLLHQCSKTVGTFSEIHRLRRHQDLDARRSRNHVAAFTARNTSRSHAGSAPRATRTTAPPISIVITLGLSAPGIPPSPRNSVTTGTNSGAASAGKLSRPPRAALRQANRCWGEMSCRRATCDTMAPGAKDSATIRPLASSFHRRRRPGPTWISTRPRRSELSTIWSTIYVNPSRKMGRMLQLRPGPARGGKKAAYRLLAFRTVVTSI